MAYTTVKEQIWKDSSYNWYVNLIYQYQQDNKNGISDIKILGFELDKQDYSGAYVGSAQICQIKCNGEDTGEWTVSSPIPTGTYTDDKVKTWYPTNQILTQIECEDSGDTSFVINYKCYNEKSGLKTPKFSDWQVLTVTLPKMDERRHGRIKVNGVWKKTGSRVYYKVNGVWIKAKQYVRINGKWHS